MQDDDALHDIYKMAINNQLTSSTTTSILKAMMGAEMDARQRPVVAQLRVELIENGYLVIYSKQGISEKRKYAKDLEEVGEVTKAACIELQLRGDQ